MEASTQALSSPHCQSQLQLLRTASQQHPSKGPARAYHHSSGNQWEVQKFASNLMGSFWLPPSLGLPRSGAPEHNTLLHHHALDLQGRSYARMQTPHFLIWDRTGTHISPSLFRAGMQLLT